MITTMWNVAIFIGEFAEAIGLFLAVWLVLLVVLGLPYIVIRDSGLRGVKKINDNNGRTPTVEI